MIVPLLSARVLDAHQRCQLRRKIDPVMRRIFANVSLRGVLPDGAHRAAERS